MSEWEVGSGEVVFMGGRESETASFTTSNDSIELQQGVQGLEATQEQAK